MIKRWWRLWCKAVGEKATPCDKESDIVATIRTFILLVYLVTNIVIVAGVLRHWDDETQVILPDVTVEIQPETE